MDTRLNAYLERIHFEGSPAVNDDTLRRLHRGHLLAISYENLDIHRGGVLTLDENLIFEKIVLQRRGGWCFEMNGLMAWALRQIGFEVTLMAGAVNRPVLGDLAEGNHLVLRVDLARPYLADAGFGTGFLEPLPLAEGSYRQGFQTYQISHHNGRWQFSNITIAAPGFDFTETPHQMSDFAAQCHRLQTSPDSGFVMNTVCHRRLPDGVISLRGAILRTMTPEGTEEQIIDTHADYDRTLREKFDLHLDDTATMWEKIWERHQAWVKSLESAS